MAEGKFTKVDHYLRVGVGMEIPNGSITRVDRVVTIPALPGVVEVRPHPTRDEVLVYLSRVACDSSDSKYPEKITLKIPAEVLEKAPWGHILMGNNKFGAQVLFGRLSEGKVFAPDKPGDYIPLRLYREKEYLFEPVYVRVDKGPDTYFFAIKARWEDDTITIEIERDPVEIPHFLT